LKEVNLIDETRPSKMGNIQEDKKIKLLFNFLLCRDAKVWEEGYVVIFILFQNPIDNFVANFELYLIRLALDSVNRP
jgi:hypothetical protein